MEEYTLKPCIEPPVQSRFAPTYDIKNDDITIAELKQELPENRYSFEGNLPKKSSSLPRVTIIENDDISSLNEKQLYWLQKIEKTKQGEAFERLSKDTPSKSFDLPKENITPEPRVEEAYTPTVEPEPVKYTSIDEPIKLNSVEPEPRMEPSYTPIPEPVLIQPTPPQAPTIPIDEKIAPIIPPFKEDAPFAEPIKPESNERKTENLYTKEYVPVIEDEVLQPPKRLKRLTADEILAQHKKDFAEKKFKPSFIAVSAVQDETDSQENQAEKETLRQAESLAELYYSSTPGEYGESE